MAEKLIIAKSINDVTSNLASGAIVLAGGTEINRLNSSVEAETLISIRKIDELKKITSAKDKVEIGAGVTFQELIDNKDVPSYVKEGAMNMGARTKRNMATIGGNIATNRDDSYIIPTLVASNAVLEIATGSKIKEVGILEYIKDVKKFKNDLIVSVVVPANRTVLNKRFSNTKESLSSVNVSVGFGEEGVTICAAVKGLGIINFDKLASKFNSSINDEDIQKEVDEKLKKLKDDFYGSANYKKYILGVTLSSMAREVK